MDIPVRCGDVIDSRITLEDTCSYFRSIAAKLVGGSDRGTGLDVVAEKRIYYVRIAVRCGFPEFDRLIDRGGADDRYLDVLYSRYFANAASLLGYTNSRCPVNVITDVHGAVTYYKLAVDESHADCSSCGPMRYARSGRNWKMISRFTDPDHFSALKLFRSFWSPGKRIGVVFWPDPENASWGSEQRKNVIIECNATGSDLLTAVGEILDRTLDLSTGHEIVKVSADLERREEIAPTAPINAIDGDDTFAQFF
jgi:hypothetical protein